MGDDSESLRGYGSRSISRAHTRNGFLVTRRQHSRSVRRNQQTETGDISELDILKARTRGARIEVRTIYLLRGREHFSTPRHTSTRASYSRNLVFKPNTTQVVLPRPRHDGFNFKSTMAAGFFKRIPTQLRSRRPPAQVSTLIITQPCLHRPFLRTCGGGR